MVPQSEKRGIVRLLRAPTRKARNIGNAVLYALRTPLTSAWRGLMVRTRVIAITGSTGKTTTKECLAAVLEGRDTEARDLFHRAVDTCGHVPAATMLAVAGRADLILFVVDGDLTQAELDALRTLAEAPGLLQMDRRDRTDFLRHFYRRYGDAPVEQIEIDARAMMHELIMTKSFPEGLRRVREAHQRSDDRQLMVGFNRRFDPTFARVREAVVGGEIAEVLGDRLHRGKRIVKAFQRAAESAVGYRQDPVRIHHASSPSPPIQQKSVYHAPDRKIAQNHEKSGVFRWRD